MLPDARQASLARPEQAMLPFSLPSSFLLPHSLLLLFSHGFVFDSSVRFAFARRLFATFTCCVFCVAYAGCCCCRRCWRCCCWGRPCCCLSRVSLNLKPAQGTRKVASRAGSTTCPMHPVGIACCRLATNRRCLPRTCWLCT